MRGRSISVVLGVAVAGGFLVAQGPPADVVLTNGRVLTVDAAFTVASAVAIRGDRVAAVGTDAQVTAFAGPRTRRVDLRGRTVVPGLIDNHLHLLRGGTTWQYEVRLDGVPTRSQALALLRARARTTPAGQWIYTLGGFDVGQFGDDPKPFTRAELDAVAPGHPLLLQASYFRSYVNSRAAQALGIDSRDGIIEEPGIRAAAARLPTASGAQLEASTRQMLRDLNSYGLTAAGSAGCEADVLPLYRRLAASAELNMRVFCITSELDPAGFPGPRRGRDAWLDHVAYGEVVHGPLHDPMFAVRSTPSPADVLQWRRLVTDVARARLQLHVHANLTRTIDAFLDGIEAVGTAHSIDGLRWTLAHLNQVNASHLVRMKRLGIAAAVHPWTVINGAINATVFGEDGARDMPPLRTIQDSGVAWGLGSDGMRANQIRPFTTMAWAVTGRMVGGRTTLRQTISREAALAAHTRSNAWLLFREKDLGSIEAGKLADLVVLDRDYLAVAADQIDDITPIMTMVGGRVVFDREAIYSNSLSR